MRWLLLFTVLTLVLPRNVLAANFRYRDCVKVTDGFYEGAKGRLDEKLGFMEFAVRLCIKDICTTVVLNSSILVKIPETECKDI